MREFETFVENLCHLFNVDTSDCCSEETLSMLYDKIEKLKQENEMLNITIDNSADNFHVTDGEGKILRVNRAFEARFRVTRDFVEGKTIYDMERLGIYRPSMSAIAIKERRQITFIQKVPAGEMISTSKPVIDSDDKVKYIVSNARLISELQLLDKYYRDKSQALNTLNATEEIVSKSPVMRSLIDLAAQVAKADSSVFLTGETGSGKSMLAKYIHENSHRHNGKFIEINCVC